MNRPLDPLVARLRAGDRDAFREAVNAHNPTLLRIATTFVPSRAVAGEFIRCRPRTKQAAPASQAR